MSDKKPALLPRTSYSLFVLDLPRLRGKALESAIRNYLVCLFPDDSCDRPLVIKKNNGKKGSYLVFVLEAGQPINPLPVSTLYVMQFFRKKTARVLFVYDNWIELILLENGTLIKSEVKSRNNFNLNESTFRFFGADMEMLDIFCFDADSLIFSGEEYPFTITMHNLEKEMGKIPVHRYSLFEHLTLARKAQKTLLLLLALSIIGGTSISLYRYQKGREKETALRRQFDEEFLRRTEADKKARQQLIELQEYYNQITDQKTAGPYETADVISRSMDDRARIFSITIRDGFFQMEAEASDSLEILKSFENNRKVRNPVLQQINPLGGRERFTISGTVLPEIDFIDPVLSPEEQLNLLETLINREEEAASGRDKMSPSSFGVNIRELLKKWNCTLNAYQYFTQENSREIEFSVRASSNSFFNFLKEASNNNGGWIFTLVQIRNLAPQNMIEAVFRVKADTVIDEELPIDVPYEEALVSKISRHYYVPPPPPPPPLPVVIIEEPEPIPPPESEPIEKPKPEQASWLEYIGATGDQAGIQYIYIKNTRNGAMIKLEEKQDGDYSYFVTPLGTIEALIDGKLYEIKRK